MMTDLERLLVLGTSYDRVLKSNGYQSKSCIHWGKVGLCIGIDIFNGAIRSAKRKPRRFYSGHRRYKRF